jgi:hypothetical protein
VPSRPLSAERVAQPLGVAGADDDLELVAVDHAHHAVELLDRVDVDPRGSMISSRRRVMQLVKDEMFSPPPTSGRMSRLSFG